MPKVTSKDGTVIAYDKRGNGPLLILVLGALNKRGSGKKLSEQLADQFTVVSYDRRGRGDSTEVLPYTTEKEVQDIDALIDELGGSAALYGHSSGAILALKAAQQLGRRVNRLALYELPYNAEPSAQAASLEYRKELQKLLDADHRGDAVSLFVKSVGVTEKQVEAMKGLPMWKGLTTMAPTLAYDTVTLMEEYLGIDAGTINTETLVMYGTKSPTFMRETAETLSRTLPHAHFRPLEDQAHDVKPDALAPVLNEFLASA